VAVCLDGHVILYRSLRKAARANGVDAKSIYAVCNGERPTCCGARWFYAEDYEDYQENCNIKTTQPKRKRGSTMKARKGKANMDKLLENVRNDTAGFPPDSELVEEAKRLNPEIARAFRETEDARILEAVLLSEPDDRKKRDCYLYRECGRNIAAFAKALAKERGTSGHTFDVEGIGGNVMYSPSKGVDIVIYGDGDNDEDDRKIGATWRHAAKMIAGLIDSNRYITSPGYAEASKKMNAAIEKMVAQRKAAASPAPAPAPAPKPNNEWEVSIDSEVFGEMKNEFNARLTWLLKTMRGTGTPKGLITLKLDVKLGADGNAVIPVFMYKIDPDVKIKNQAKGAAGGEGFTLADSPDAEKFLMRKTEDPQLDMFEAAEGENHEEAEATDADEEDKDEGILEINFCAQKLRRILKERGIATITIANAINNHTHYVNKLLRGATRPYVTEVANIASLLCIPYGDLCEDKEDDEEAEREPE
jgi:hypothetical protein